MESAVRPDPGAARGPGAPVDGSVAPPQALGGLQRRCGEGRGE